VTPLILSAALLSAPPDDAEALLRAVDVKIAAAKTLRIEFELRMPDGPERSQAGELVLADRNRFRVEFWYDDPRKLGIMVGNGKRAWLIGPDKTSAEATPYPDWHNEVLRSWLARGGTYASLLAVSFRSRDQKPGPADGPRAANARLLPDEEVRGVKCRVVGYDLTWPERRSPDGRSRELSPPDARVRVWIDPKTTLPVRREMTWPSPLGRGFVTWVATHTRFDIDPQLDDGLFEKPTEADLLLARMDATIRNARSLRMEVTITSPGGLPPLPARGSVVLDDRNRFRLELALADDTPKTTWIAVADGKAMVGVGGSGPVPVPPYLKGLVPAWHNDVLRRWLGKGGTMFSVQAMAWYLQRAKGKEPGPEVGPFVSKSRLLPDEEIGGTKARVVEYDLTWKGVWDVTGEPTPVKVRVSIDPKTSLPVRRTVDWGPRSYLSDFTATHTRTEIDPKLDDKLFELPK
jgi:outer membrane lipoprotein-sorting protein